MSIKIGIVGYGNLGKGVELAAKKNPDIKIEYVFTRRDPKYVRTYGTPVLSIDKIASYKGKLDCLILAGGSRSDLPYQTPMLSEDFNTVDSFDNHNSISEHIKRVGEAAGLGGKTSIVSAGWDPGILSLARLYAASFMPYAAVNTFWGRGVSQGHSDAIRRITGVKKAVQYTVPRNDARLLAKGGIRVSGKEAHKRVCYVVAEKEDEQRIKEQITAMPDYFLGYDTEVNFISEEEFNREHLHMSHHGEVIAVGMSGLYESNAQSATLSLELDSNPEFTAYILVAAARAAVRLNREEKCGAYTFFDIPPKYFLKDDFHPLL